MLGYTPKASMKNKIAMSEEYIDFFSDKISDIKTNNTAEKLPSVFMGKYSQPKM